MLIGEIMRFEKGVEKRILVYRYLEGGFTEEEVAKRLRRSS